MDSQFLKDKAMTLSEQLDPFHVMRPLRWVGERLLMLIVTGIWDFGVYNKSNGTPSHQFSAEVFKWVSTKQLNI